jgi:hypothetical protein
MIQKLKDIFKYMNEKGLSIPLLRDKDKPSVSLTLLWISSVFVILGLLSLSISWLQINVFEALAWHVTSAVLYYNRRAKISKDGIEISASEDNKQE